MLLYGCKYGCYLINRKAFTAAFYEGPAGIYEMPFRADEISSLI